MIIKQLKDVREILSFVQNHRKKQTDDIMNLLIQSARKQSGKPASYAKWRLSYWIDNCSSLIVGPEYMGRISNARVINAWFNSVFMAFNNYFSSYFNGYIPYFRCFKSMSKRAGWMRIIF